MVLDIIALVVMLVIAGVGIWLVVIIGGLPGKMARAANHPQTNAINMLAWVGLITGVGWFLALIWAQTKPGPAVPEQPLQAPEQKQAGMEEGQ